MASGSGFGLGGQLTGEKQANKEPSTKAPVTPVTTPAAPRPTVAPTTTTVAAPDTGVTGAAAQEKIAAIHGEGGPRSAEQGAPLPPQELPQNIAERAGVLAEQPNAYKMAGVAPVEGSPEAAQAEIDKAQGTERVGLSPAGAEAIQGIINNATGPQPSAHEALLQKVDLTEDQLSRLKELNPNMTEDQVIGAWAKQKGIDLNAQTGVTEVPATKTEEKAPTNVLEEIIAAFRMGSEQTVQNTQSGLNAISAATLINSKNLYDQALASGNVKKWYMDHAIPADSWWSPSRQAYYNTLIGNLKAMSDQTGLPVTDWRVMVNAADRTRETLGDISQVEAAATGLIAPTPENIALLGSGKLLSAGIEAVTTRYAALGVSRALAARAVESGVASTKDMLAAEAARGGELGPRVGLRDRLAGLAGDDPARLAIIERIPPETSAEFISGETNAAGRITAESTQAERTAAQEATIAEQGRAPAAPGTGGALKPSTEGATFNGPKLTGTVAEARAGGGRIGAFLGGERRTAITKFFSDIGGEAQGKTALGLGVAGAAVAAAGGPEAVERGIAGGLKHLGEIDIRKLWTDILQPAGFKNPQEFFGAVQAGDKAKLAGVPDGVIAKVIDGYVHSGKFDQGVADELLSKIVSRAALDVKAGTPAGEAVADAFDAIERGGAPRPSLSETAEAVKPGYKVTIGAPERPYVPASKRPLDVSAPTGGGGKKPPKGPPTAVSGGAEIGPPSRPYEPAGKGPAGMDMGGKGGPKTVEEKAADTANGQRYRAYARKQLSILAEKPNAADRTKQSLMNVFGIDAKTADAAIKEALDVSTERGKLEKALEVAGVLKTTFSAGDISGAGRQGRAFLAYPDKYLPAFKRQVEVVFGKGEDFADAQSRLYENVAKLGGDKAKLGFTTTGSYLHGGEEAFPAANFDAEKFAEKRLGIPGKVWAKIVGNSNEAYVSFLNDVSAAVFVDEANFAKGVLKLDGAEYDKAMAEIADRLNHGRMRLTSAPSGPNFTGFAMTMANTAMFSPGMRAARATFVFKDFPLAVARMGRVLPKAMVLAAKGEKFPLTAAGFSRADQVTLRLGLGWAVSTAALYTIAVKASGIESVDLNPASTNFLRVDLGEYGARPAAITAVAEIFGIGAQQYGGHAYLDLSNGISQEIRTIYRLMTGHYKGANPNAKEQEIKWATSPLRDIPAGYSIQEMFPFLPFEDMASKGKKPGPFEVTKESVIHNYIVNAMAPAARAASNATGFADDTSTDGLNNPILGSAIFGVIGNTLQAFGIGQADKKSLTPTPSGSPRPRIGGGG